MIDTAEVGRGESFARWAAAHRRLFPALELRRRSLAPFSGKMWRYDLGAVVLFRLAAEASAVRWTPSATRAGDLGWIQLVLQLDGTSRVRQDGRVSLVRAGDLTSYGSQAPYELAALTPFDLLVVTFPQKLLHPHVERVRQRTATAFSGATGVGRVTGPFLTEVLRGLEDRSIRSDDAQVAESLLDLVRALHAGPAADRRGASGSAPALRRRILAYIDAHLGDPQLSRETIADQHFISVSYLDKLLEATGTSTWRYVRARRLDRCRRDLGDRALASESILAIASRWGFTTAAHFSRTFRAVYDVTPRAFRRAALAADRPRRAGGPVA